MDTLVLAARSDSNPRRGPLLPRLGGSMLLLSSGAIVPKFPNNLFLGEGRYTLVQKSLVIIPVI